MEKMGVMEAMYGIADAALVGGTFDATGGHNMWDAAQFGIPVLFGPNFSTQRESGDALIAAGIGFCVDGAENLALAIVRALRNNEPRLAEAKTVFAQKTNESVLHLQELIP